LQILTKSNTPWVNLPSVPRQKVAGCLPALLELIAQKKIRLFASSSYHLVEARAAFHALEGRKTIGKVVLIPRPDELNLVH